MCFRLLLPHSAPSNTSGYLANLSPLSFRRGTGRGFCRASVQAFEIPLQIIRHYYSQINPLSLKTAFVTFRESVSYKQACKRCPFALQNMPFYTSKDALLHCKRASFTTQKGVYGKIEGKEIDKNNPQNTASPSPSRGRGCAWRDMECCGLGRWKDGELDLKGVCLFLMVKCLEVKNRFSRTQTDYILIRKFVVFRLQFPYL